MTHHKHAKHAKPHHHHKHAKHAHNNEDNADPSFMDYGDGNIAAFNDFFKNGNDPLGFGGGNIASFKSFGTFKSTETVGLGGTFGRALVVGAGREAYKQHATYRANKIQNETKVRYGLSKKRDAMNEMATKERSFGGRYRMLEGEAEDVTMMEPYNLPNKYMNTYVFDDEELWVPLDVDVAPVASEALQGGELSDMIDVELAKHEEMVNNMEILDNYSNAPEETLNISSTAAESTAMDALGMAGIIGTVLWNFAEAAADPDAYAQSWDDMVSSANPYKDLNDSQKADIDSMRASGSSQTELDTAAFNYAISNAIVDSGNGVVEDANVFANTAAMINGDAPEGATANITAATDTLDKADTNVAEATAPLSNFIVDASEDIGNWWNDLFSP